MNQEKKQTQSALGFEFRPLMRHGGLLLKDKDVSKRGIFLYLHLLDLRNGYPTGVQTRRVTISQLQSDLGYTPKTLKRAMLELERASLILTQERSTRRGEGEDAFIFRLPIYETEKCEAGLRDWQEVEVRDNDEQGVEPVIAHDAPFQGNVAPKRGTPAPKRGQMDSNQGNVAPKPGTDAPKRGMLGASNSCHDSLSAPLLDSVLDSSLDTSLDAAGAEESQRVKYLEEEGEKKERTIEDILAESVEREQKGNGQKRLVRKEIRDVARSNPERWVDDRVFAEHIQAEVLTGSHIDPGSEIAHVIHTEWRNRFQESPTVSTMNNSSSESVTPSPKTVPQIQPVADSSHEVRVARLEKPVLEKGDGRKVAIEVAIRGKLRMNTRYNDHQIVALIQRQYADAGEDEILAVWHEMPQSKDGHSLLKERLSPHAIADTPGGLSPIGDYLSAIIDTGEVNGANGANGKA